METQPYLGLNIIFIETLPYAGDVISVGEGEISTKLTQDRLAGEKETNLIGMHRSLVEMGSNVMSLSSYCSQHDRPIRGRRITGGRNNDII